MQNNVEQIILETIININNNITQDPSQFEWNNFIILKDLIKHETSTVDYMLRALSYNYIGDEPFNIIKINNNIEIDTLDNYKLVLPNIKPRLIIAFGPSASGKTTCSNNIIQKLLNEHKDFPTCFMTIDGGNMRKASNVFQMIIKYANMYNINIASYNIFPKVKNTIIKYYESQIEKYNTMISLYIPITLGKTYIQSYSNFIELTKDSNWVGIFIWQHKNDCIYEDKYKCYGCIKSGIEREKIEGKKYKPHKWDLSMERGLIEVKKAKGGFYCIHNGGKDHGIMLIDNDLLN